MENKRNENDWQNKKTSMQKIYKKEENEGGPTTIPKRSKSQNEKIHQ
jgi:hypothetical protein